MTIDGVEAMCEMTFIVSWTVKYRTVMKMELTTKKITEMSYGRYN
jgi:hypothetical protein